MPITYEVRPYHPGDEKGIVELLELAFNGWPHFDLECKPLEHWRWKHEDNPLGKSIISVAARGKEIIGCVHSIPKMFNIRGRPYLCYDVVDVAVHPDFRGLGVYSKIDGLLKGDLLKKADAYLAYGVTANPIVLKRGKKVGWIEFPFTVLNLVRILDFNLHLKIHPTEHAWLKKQSYLALKAANRIRNFCKLQSSSRSRFHIDEIDRYDECINEFYEKIKDYYDFIIIDFSGYFNWRYYDTRGGKYTIKKIELDNVMLGYSILRINRYNKEYPIGYIADLITLPDQIDAAHALFADAIQYFDDQNINMVNYWAIKNNPCEKIAKKYGFIQSSKIHAHYDALGKEIELDKIKMTSPKTFHFAIGYTDWI